MLIPAALVALWYAFVAMVVSGIVVGLGYELLQAAGTALPPPQALGPLRIGLALILFAGIVTWDVWRNIPRSDEWLVDHGRARLVARDDVGTLWLVRGPADSAPRTMVEVRDATPGPDGTRERYLLRVPPHVTTPRAAVAWTFGLERASDYRPLVEA